IEEWQDKMFQLHKQGKWGEFSTNPTTWLKILNMGHRIPGVVNSRTIDNFHGNSALRNYVLSDANTPAEIDPINIVDQVRAGHVMVTTGPYLTVTARTKAREMSTLPGGALPAPGGQITLDVSVQCPNWIQVDALQVLINGKMSAAHSLTRKVNPEAFSLETLQLRQQIEITLKQDSHIIVVASGTGRNLNRRDATIPVMKAHVALTNPIYVDVDGKGFAPQSPLLDRVYTALTLKSELSLRADAPPAIVELSLRNLSPNVAEDSLNVRLLPVGHVKVVGKNHFAYRLKPGKSTKIEIPIKMIDRSAGGLLDEEIEAELLADEPEEDAGEASGAKQVDRIALFVPRSGIGVGRRATGIEITAGTAGSEVSAKLNLPRDVHGRPKNWQHDEYYGPDDAPELASEGGKRTTDQVTTHPQGHPETEWVTLHEDNYQAFVPQGKEVDAIYGDTVLRNKQITATIGNPILQTGNQGGRFLYPEYYSNIIDLTRRDAPNDLLGVYSGGVKHPSKSGTFRHVGYRSTSVAYTQGEYKDRAPNHFKKDAKKLLDTRLVVQWPYDEGRKPIAEWGRYTLENGASSILFQQKYNSGLFDQGKPEKLMPAGRLGLGPTMESQNIEQGFDKDRRLFWVYDPWHGGAYGIYSEQARIKAEPYTGNREQHGGNKGGGVELTYMLDKGQAGPEHASSLAFGVRLFPAQDVFELREYVAKWKKQTLYPVSINIKKGKDAPQHVLISAYHEKERYGLARVETGKLFKAKVPWEKVSIYIQCSRHQDAGIGRKR
ncbi:MAG: hypothetical protein QF473_30130, partial [Planctomycetota bacterium]|nr:hypothetical protein [Planctomycetota bacterium]